MKLLNQEISYKIYRYLFQALAIAIPIHDKLVPPLILLIALNWIVELNFGEKLQNFKNQSAKKYLLLPIILYLLYVAGTFYSSQLKGSSGALFDLEVKLSLLLFPVFFTTIDFSKFKKDFTSKILKAFIFGCLISSIILINNAVMNYFKDQDASVFYYTGLSWMHHPSYLALFFSFAIAILIVWVIEKGHENLVKRNLAILIIIHFQIFIVLLSSKAGIIGMFVIITSASLFYLLKDRKKIKRVLTVLSIILTTGILILIIFPSSFNRFSALKNSINDNRSANDQQAESTAARLLVWNSSLQIIKENFIFGVGTGDVKSRLLNKYKEMGITSAFHDRLNAHNQFLQTFIAIGLPGFLLLVISIMLPTIYAYKKRNLLLVLFAIMFSVHILVESMLERQAGVIFFAFFMVLLLVSDFPANQESEP